ncbi:GH39 family glycosyl hydrolase [Coriobacterium glomerans]|nr:helix-turn-helix domain-containing protein [Coriobacterium glomerans]
MGAHYRERLTLNLVANRFYLDPAYLSRLIRRETGINFKAHLTQMRIECAKRFLTQSSMSIARVATECGYTNLSSFNTACNRLLGMTPSEYRAKTSITAIAKDVSAGEESHRYQQLRQREKIRDQMRETRRIDMAMTGDPLKPIWTELLNIGSVRELLHGHIKRQIAFIQGQIAFKYGRMWGLFGPEALCDLEKGEYANFGTLDEALDAVIEVGLIPWIVIGKCSDPERLYECENKAWQHALSSFLSHVLDRYGKQLIVRWRIEMVFEGDPSSPQFDIYRDRLAFTRKRIKDIDQAMLIGGAGFQQLSDEGKLSERIKSIAYLLDFVSLKVFPYSGSSEVGEQRHPMRIVETGVFIESVQRVRAAMMHAGVSVPIYVTEWSNTISTEDLINDTLFKGCFIIKTCIEAIDSVAGMGYWLASDWYSAEQRSGSLLTGGPGLITKDRIPKPALSAFGFLAELTERKLIFKSEDCLICQREGDSSILGFNYVQPEKTYYLKDESSFQPGEVLSLFKEEKKRCSFLLTHLRNGAYEIRTYSCDARYGSIFNQWATLGFAKHLRRSDIEYLKNNSNMHMELEERMITDGVCRIDRLAGANEFFLINLRYCAKTNK